MNSRSFFINPNKIKLRYQVSNISILSFKCYFVFLYSKPGAVFCVVEGLTFIGIIHGGRRRVFPPPLKTPLLFIFKYCIIKNVSSFIPYEKTTGSRDFSKFFLAHSLINRF